MPIDPTPEEIDAVDEALDAYDHRLFLRRMSDEELDGGQARRKASNRKAFERLSELHAQGRVSYDVIREMEDAAYDFPH